MVQYVYQMLHVSWTYTHHDVAGLLSHDMVRNTKTWISCEQNITFLRNKKFLTCASDDAIWEIIVL